MAAKGWTPGGNVKATQRAKSATYTEGGQGKFPIFDKHSAESALKLIGKAPKSEQVKIRAKARKFGAGKASK